MNEVTCVNEVTCANEIAELWKVTIDIVVFHYAICYLLYKCE